MGILTILSLTTCCVGLFCLNFTVHCRIGSLENAVIINLTQREVHCRIGSLENALTFVELRLHVHCRIGSLEKNEKSLFIK